MRHLEMQMRLPASIYRRLAQACNLLSCLYRLPVRHTGDAVRVKMAKKRVKGRAPVIAMCQHQNTAIIQLSIAVHSGNDMAIQRRKDSAAGRREHINAQMHCPPPFYRAGARQKGRFRIDKSRLQIMANKHLRAVQCRRNKGHSFMSAYMRRICRQR